MRCEKIDIWPPYNIITIFLVFALPFIAAALLDADSGVKVFMLMFGSSQNDPIYKENFTQGQLIPLLTYVFIVIYCCFENVFANNIWDLVKSFKGEEETDKKSDAVDSGYQAPSSTSSTDIEKSVSKKEAINTTATMAADTPRNIN